ncbi:chaplin [Streptomyces sp. NPDC016459]|uniref:chaplin n=1 Tax=Streptomyces sp. NPDC016459 TaxID=3157190 RepID=UPI0033CF52FC
MSRFAKSVAVTLAAGAMVAGGAGMAAADAVAEGVAVGSPGVLSGNVVQVPIHIPINVCGNTVNVVGLLNPAFGNTCINGDFKDGHKGEHKGEHNGEY